MTTTLAHLIDRHGVDVLDYLDRQASVPVVAGLQFQGDVAIVPAAIAGRAITPASTPVPKAGVAVVRGESGGNTHSLHASPTAFFDAALAGSGVVLGTLTVPDASEAYLAHPEHGFVGIAPGTYRIGRQREKTDEFALVVD